jgi:hypothetical protein
VQHLEVAHGLVDVEVVGAVDVLEATDRPGSGDGTSSAQSSDPSRPTATKTRGVRDGVERCPELAEGRIGIGVFDASVPIGCREGGGLSAAASASKPKTWLARLTRRAGHQPKPAFVALAEAADKALHRQRVVASLSEAEAPDDDDRSAPLAKIQRRLEDSLRVDLEER